MAFWTRVSHRKESPADTGLPAPPAPSDPRADVLVESYVEWREECIGLETAYRRWTESNGLGRDLAFSAYRAALDREQEAAGAYARAAGQLVVLHSQ